MSEFFEFKRRFYCYKKKRFQLKNVKKIIAKK